MQERNYFSFNILLHRISWKDIRILFIGFYKNDLNNQCFVNLLSNDLLNHIIKFIGIKSSKSKNKNNAPNKNGVFELQL